MDFFFIVLLIFLFLYALFHASTAEKPVSKEVYQIQQFGNRTMHKLIIELRNKKIQND